MVETLLNVRVLSPVFGSQDPPPLGRVIVKAGERTICDVQAPTTALAEMLGHAVRASCWLAFEPERFCERPSTAELADYVKDHTRRMTELGLVPPPEDP